MKTTLDKSSSTASSTSISSREQNYWDSWMPPIPGIPSQPPSSTSKFTAPKFTTLDPFLIGTPLITGTYKLFSSSYSNYQENLNQQRLTNHFRYHRDIDRACHENLVTNQRAILSVLREHQNPQNIDEADKAIEAVTAILDEKGCGSLAVFPRFYGELITKNVRAALENPHYKIKGKSFQFTDKEFMRRLPGHFARLYIEALITFLENPEKLKNEKPVWYTTFTNGLKRSNWAFIDGMLGIVSHIMKDLGEGIMETMIELKEKELHKKHPGSVYTRQQLAKAVLEDKAKIARRKIDHDKVNLLIESLLYPTLNQFISRGDPLSGFISTIDSISKDSSQPLGVPMKWGMAIIKDVREVAWKHTLEALKIEAMDEGEVKEKTRAAYLKGLNEKSQAVAQQLFERKIVLYQSQVMSEDFDPVRMFRTWQTILGGSSSDNFNGNSSLEFHVAIEGQPLTLVLVLDGR